MSKYNWRAVCLGDLITVKHGFAFKGEFFADDGDYILLTPGNFEPDGGLKFKGEKEKYYAGPIPQDFVLEAGDLLVVMTDLTQGAAILGSMAIVPCSGKLLHNQRLGKVLLRDQGVDRKFLYYLMNNRRTRDQIVATATGATVKHTSPGRIGEAKVVLPGKEVQQRIGAILSAYDDLIEVNQRRIAILEEMARRLFEEWFVRFRYPGHEAVPLVESDLGPIPQGWSNGVIADKCELIARGIAPKYDENGPSVVINQKCVRGQSLSLMPARRQSKPIPEDKLLRRGDCLINSTGVGTLGRVAQVLCERNSLTVDSHVSIVRPAAGVDATYFGAQILALEPHFERQGVGATGQTELSRKAIADTPIKWPPLELMERFGRIVAPNRTMAEALREANARLRAARDLLLPKLISGEIEVGVAEASLAEAAE